MRPILSAFILFFITAPSFARDGEVFFRNKGRVEVGLGPGSRLELVDCDGSYDDEGTTNEGVTCSIKVINDHKTPYRMEVQSA